MIKCLLAVRQYLRRLQEDNRKIRISEEVAKFLFRDKGIVHIGGSIRKWADHYLHIGSLPER
jgi:hypothetical protein